MGDQNEHKEFRITSIKKTHTNITPSIEMRGATVRKVRTHNILEHHRVSLIANDPTEFPPDPELNEVAMKNRMLYIYSKEGGIADWRPLGGGGGSVEIVPATNIIEDNDHRFVNNTQLTAVQQLVDGQVPAHKIIEETDLNFVTDSEKTVINDLMDGVEIDGGNLT